MSTAEIQAIERSIKAAKNTVDYGAAVARLRANKDFKKVVLEGYFEQEAIRLVHLKADPHTQDPDVQRSIVAAMDSIGAFSQFLRAAERMGDLAGKSIAADEAELTELQAEELTHG